ncbi:unnamed protein product [Didymodactylos carnosus]|uniref:Midasin n=1 Tax=Didymodactylos carnosus TaxID=1234261 RepID=A0A815T8U2_9BILA|nr:unnamed protein product [Didymodactylos carnosus]CAF4361638.1 unnamed protein product [Didymodactylos carnosus]
MAIKVQRWIIFDDLNLAALNVLEGLKPLFYRNSTHFTIPTTGETVDIKNVLLLATMNPSTIGGKLLRSIYNLFTIVTLDDYSDDELYLILHRLFTGDLENRTIDMNRLDALFNIHTSLKLRVRQGTLERIGGSYELNLYDLSKFRDVFRGSIVRQLFHYQYINTSDDDNQEHETIEELSPVMSGSDAPFLFIRKLAQVVYACQFQDQKDFVQACELINSKFPINSALRKLENDCSVDASTATVVRIGSIYIMTGSKEPSPTDIGLIYTKKTVRQLELLAAACQSKRAILLEGDICSRKSSLVMELACLTRHRLIIIPLHENFETVDLIGSWRPNSDHEQKDPLFNQIDTMFKQIINVLCLSFVK